MKQGVEVRNQAGHPDQLGRPVTEMPRQHLPAEMASLPPGPQLAAVLAGMDLSRLNGHDLITLAPAVVKMISHYQAQLAVLVDQVDHCPPGDAGSPAQRVSHPNRWAQVDIAARLHWTAGRAEHELRYATHLARLPTRANAGPLCRRDHRYKHESGAHLEQPQPGVFAWTTQFGHRYTIRPDPYDETAGLATQRLERILQQTE